MEDWDKLDENSRLPKGSETKDLGIGETKKKVAFRGNLFCSVNAVSCGGFFTDNLTL